MQWFEVVLKVLPWMISLLLLAWKLGAKGQQIMQGPEVLAERIRQVEIRLEHAGEKISTLTTAVQALPESLRATFLAKELADEYVSESRNDRRTLHQQIDKLQASQRLD